uniref:Pheromone n=1 Tax=Lentinula edodes TaxID=5353 RepID=A0A2U9Q1M0_LENED|nr:Pheromone [Lentinula edodes]AWT57998.1 Pheromone [Lentinula edodes]AWT58055.1 Pheromone [Lentinula edodes]AWT58061.1 Pheromone [Lentinula edodes]
MDSFAPSTLAALAPASAQDSPASYSLHPFEAVPIDMEHDSSDSTDIGYCVVA